MRKIFLLTFALLSLALVVQAADVTGKWVAQVPGRQGATTENTFTFKQSGETLTGTITTPRGETPISDGKVVGDDISFKQALEFGGNSITFLYKGKLSGDEIKFTREREGGGGKGGPQEFVAKKSAS
jgi:hypothetical protein